MQITKHAKLEKKQVDDVLGGEEAWKNVQKTDGELMPGSSPVLFVISFMRQMLLAGQQVHTFGLQPHCRDSIVNCNGTASRLTLMHVVRLPAVTCPACSAGQAYFMEVQIRSADEPATIFYKCVNPECNHIWREG